MSDSGSESATSNVPPTEVAPVELASADTVINYLKKLAAVILEDGSGGVGSSLSSLDACFRDATTIDAVKRFISDHQTPVLVLERIPTVRDEDGEMSATESELESETATYNLTTEVHFSSQKASSILLIKRSHAIEADKSVVQQVRMISLTEGNPYETLHSYVSTAVAPYFKSYIRESGRGDSYRDGDKLAPSVEKKLSELEIGLLHLQQNIEIPEIHLPAHPVIQAVIKKAIDENRKPKVGDLADRVEDSSFLNQLQNGVNRWIREIQKVTKLDRDPASGTAIQEITFWLNLERALLKLYQKRESDEVTLTLEALKHGKRFHATVSFDTDTGLKQAMSTVNDYNLLMKDFPLNDLLSATELDKIRSALLAIFAHLRKIRNTKYPIQRALRLVEAISRDLQGQMLKVLNTRRLMHIPMADFDKLMNSCFEVFSAWDDEYDKLSALMRDISKKKREEQMKLTWRITPPHKKLQARLEQMRKFRRAHEQLRTVISRVLRPAATKAIDMDKSTADLSLEPAPLDSADANAIEEVNVAYENVKEVDCLDLTKEGTDAWEAALRRYEERIDRVEARITSRLRDQLGGAKNANEMFLIFSRFNALFIRPHIRGAIREYQAQLILRVKEDIESLQRQFTVHYVDSTASNMSQARDLPPVSGSIIWIKQIDRQLSTYMKRIEDVLGRGWENHVEGRQLKQEGDNFRLKLNTQHIFDDWVAKVQARNLAIVGKVYVIESVRRSNDGKSVLRLRVNFSPEVITLSKEVRNLKNMGFRIPLPVVNKAHQANQLYPFAISLLESVRTYDSINEKIADKRDMVLLVAGHKRDIQNQISEGGGLIWESYKMDPYVKKFADTINQYQEKVEELLIVQDAIDAQLAAMDTCQYAAPTIAALLVTIQKAVDQLSLGNYSNLHIWVQKLDEEIEKKLAFRLQEGVRAWTRVLEGRNEQEDLDSTDHSPEQAKVKAGGEPDIQTMVHEMRLTSQVMYLSPSIEEARSNLLQQLFAWEAIITTQQRISSTRYQVAIDRNNSESTYRNLLAKLPEGQSVLEQAYTAVENLLSKVREYVGEWLRYQALWDLQPDMLYERLGQDLNKWMKTLVEIKKSRNTFDTQETRKEIAPIVVDYAKVQSKVSLKYDNWHREVLQKFGGALGVEMQTFFGDVSKSRSELEQQSVDAGTTSEAVGFITYVQGLKRQTKQWQDQVDMFREGQRLLSFQRFQFPTNWLHADNIDGEWSAFTDILGRKDSAIQTQVSNLQSKICQEDKVVENRTADVLADWEKNKPTEGSQKPDQAMAALQSFEAKLNKLKEDRDNIVKAKDALELADTAQPSVHAEKLSVALEELQDLKGVWHALNPVYAALDEMKDKPWLSVQPRKLRSNLDALLSQLKELPSKYRSYESYDHAKRMMQNYARMNQIVIELKSEALKERHWKQMMKQLKVNWTLTDLTLGQVWDADLVRHEAAIKDIMLVAQGEMALEEFLKQVRESWQVYEIELVNYQNKTKLIKGWEDLFNKLKEHINSLAAMRLSPYYKEFEEDALAWEDKLNRVNTLFDVWIDVQRRWVYLEGIFSGSADIKTLLPTETGRFGSISTEFLGLMKKVSASPRVMEIVNFQGVQRLLERLADLLAKIQKALGEYLERERSSFPRFYFVGDEDLLEIIGNSKNIPRLQKHFKKMFAGVAAILLNEDNSIVTGLASREGEEIVFSQPVSIKENPRINDWLRRVESEMRNTLAKMLAQSVQDFAKFKSGQIDPAEYMQWLDRYPAQIIGITVQISWSEEIEGLLGQGKPVTTTLQSVNASLNLLADGVLQEQPPLRRKKLEHLITEFVHKRDITRGLIEKGINNAKSFEWLCVMRFYFDPKEVDVLKRLSIQMANSSFHYGFEYLGVQERLVQTPLTDRCYLTMTEALEAKLGGSPFGPAGTGKTETVKALGNQLGRFVLVFNCDETFDFQAMGRIFVGLCQVGAWGCFDEFNRLEERMLSAVSQQVQAIQETLRTLKGSKDVELSVDLVGKQVRVNPDMAIFITMNPGYAGRSNLPDNLKQLFRSLAMTQPDRQLIAQVMLFSQGFRTAERLAQKIVPFFILCQEQLSNQSHYDFGLRALKYVLVSSGNIKRDRIQKMKEDATERGETLSESQIAEQLPEQEILIQSVCETMVPKLVAEDIPLLFSLLSDVFPGVAYSRAEMKKLREEIAKVCEERFLCYSEVEGELGYAWVEKVLQLFQITNLNHGLMMVGPSGSGKSSAWRVLLTALERFEGVEGVAHVIDPKAISKDALYGTLDPTTREWTDGLFTHILRKIIDNVRGEIDKRQWIIFDGDVDPEWVENLNSVLDDNKLLTLPNGERLAIPPNVRIMFEVQDLRYATLATVSRCGMVWFSDDVITTDMLFDNYLQKLRCVSLDEIEAAAAARGRPGRTMSAPTNDSMKDEMLGPNLQVQRDVANVLTPHLAHDGLVARCLQYADEKLDHIMDFTKLRALGSFFAMVNFTVRQIQAYNQSHSDFPMANDQVERYVLRSLITNVIWAFSGDGRLKIRQELSDYVRSITTIALPPQDNVPIIDYEVTLSGEWSPWSAKVPQIEVETHKVAAPDLVVPTLDTVRHEHLLQTWLAEHKPLVLCGPPGSGKTMTLFSALRSTQDMEVVGLNFSSATTPELLLKTFDHYCEYKRTPNGVVLAPIQLGRWLIMFCDEINLPNMDKYGTQRVISFLRQIVEHNGFYRTSDQTWVTLERIQFVGACNPPTDPGRKPLSHRFLRHVPVVYVDYPGETSLKQIYGTFNRAMLRIIPSLRTYAEPLTAAMVEFYLASQERFTQDQQPHYVYSPRELTRWVRGIFEAIRPLESLSVEGLVRLWAHEALRLFQDRLITNEERKWTDENIDAVAQKHFPTINSDEALKRPILYSCWLTKDYLPVDREELRSYVKARLKVFYEEELDVQLVLFNEVLEHVLRIDRIYRQQQGHLLLIGVSGSGKTTLSRFVAWMNGLSVFQLKVHSKYSAEDFDEDLRSVLRRSGCRNEKICFIMDESNIMDTGFLERLNTLLANGEVPGLFEGDEHTTLMTQIKEGSQRDGLMLDSQEELYKWFTNQVIRNLHVVFTMNPSSEGLRDRASTSPALFNRCVLNWFGDWSDSALFQVGKEFTHTLDIEKAKYDAPGGFPYACEDTSRPPNYREAVTNAFVHVHQTLHAANRRQARRGNRTMAITPRHYLDFINHYVKLFHEKRTQLEDEKLHLNVGLNKIRETEDQVKELQKSLSLKSQELEAKNAAANAKLKQMLSDQQRAEKEKQVSEQIQKELHEKMIAIDEKKKTVQEDLDQVEPAVAEAQTAVKGIRKQQLVEVRSMAQPPPGVKLALESICLLLGENVGTDWKAIRGVIVKEDFMPRILGFNTDQITADILAGMKKYAQNPDWDFDKINRASQACGPMVKWAKAQLLYSDMLHKVEPLRNELNRLEKDAGVAKLKGEEVKNTIAKLEESIAAYKEEYAQLIGQAETIKAGLASVQEKVGRSIELLRSLGSERDRWEKSCEGFSAQMETIVGDVLLSAAFLAYAGYFDQQLRQQLFLNWSHHLELSGIQFRSDMARVEYLSNPDERLKWQQNALPVDDLCTENAIMLHRFNRYPLIIDPSGQATEFLLNEFGGKKITKTSFLDDAFRKNLESALRFGNPLLVQDVESYDPILNPVLNREVKRTGGRVLITLGDQDIDLSPSFQIFLSTRDPTVEFPPDVCSRVTFVNFTVTRGSLQTQCLNQVLKSERPDVDKKRSDLLKLQGEFALRLRQLEKALLQALNDSKGKILDDNSVIATLETLKNEAAEVQKKSAETDVVMAEVERTSQVYTPMSQACSLIYFTLEQLNQIHFLYQYSLQFFLDIFTAVLSENNEHLKGVTDYSQRLSIITSDLFQMTYNRVAQGMLHEDKITYAILLAKIYLKGLANEPTYDTEFDHLLRGVERLGVAKGNEVGNIPGLHADQLEGLTKLVQLPAFAQAVDVVKKSPDFAAWVTSDNPEKNVPKMWQEKTPLSKIGSAIHALLVIQALRPDRWLASAHIFVSAVFGNEFMLQAQAVLDLSKMVDVEIKANTPVLLCSAPGYDASGRVEDMAAEMNKTVTPIAIGSAEGFTQADAAINSANKAGRWVLLKNVHLAPQWLGQLEKKLHTLNPHPQFRLFLTTEIHPKLPVNLLRTGRIFVFEPPPGVKANLLRTFSTISAPRMSKAPAERARLYFMLSWFHAIVQERLRYTPLGWAKQYEFSEADFRVACDTLDACVDATAMGRANLPPEKVPWDALQTLLSQCIYGGKIDNKFDQTLLDCFIRKLFTAKSFDPDCVLIHNIDGQGENLLMPDGVRREQFVQWTENIKHLQVPSWLGLPNSAEKVLLTIRAREITTALNKMKEIEDEEMSTGQDAVAKLLKVSEVDEELAYSKTGETAEGVTAPQWMKTLQETSATWLKLLPKSLPTMKRTIENIKDPLYRFFEREVNLGSRLLVDVRNDLEDVLMICAGKKKQTNDHRALTSSLNKGIVPDGWRRYTVPNGVTVINWIQDLAERIVQLQRVVDMVKQEQAKGLKKLHVWLGGLFTPEAYITATRQYVAQANAWSLEELQLQIQVADSFDKLNMDDCSFALTGMKLMGAKCTGGRRLAVSDDIWSELSAVQLKWVHAPSTKQNTDAQLTLPVYLYQTRANLLFTLDFDVDDTQKAIFYERGVAVICTTSLA